MLISLVSVKGAPGVTTTAAALASVGAESRAREGWQQGVDLVELDPGGGDVEGWTGATGEPGLLRAATDLRPESMAGHTVEAPGGVRSLLAPMSPLEAVSTVMAALDEWGPVLSTIGLVIVDGGRWDRAHPAAGRLAGSDLVVVVCRPDARSVEHVRHVVGDLRVVAHPGRVVVATVGERPYRCGEVAGVLGLEPVGALAWDPRGVSALWASAASRGRFRRWSVSPLARSARAVLAALMEQAGWLVAR